MSEKFEIKSGVFLTLHYSYGQPDHLRWGNTSNYTELPFEKGHGWNNQELLLLGRIKTEDEFVRFMKILADMHGLNAVRKDVPGDKQDHPGRCILIEFCDQ